MKKIDWYIVKKFLGTFVFIMLLLLGITIVIDISEKIDDLVEANLSTWQIVKGYYLFFLPFITSLIGPFFVLVACIFFTSQLASRSEIIAILSSGTSFYRFLYPYFVGASILAGSFFVFNHFLVPYANAHRLEFERKYIYTSRDMIRFNFHRTVEPGTIVYVENYKPGAAEGYKFSLDKFVNGELVYKLMADRIEWNKKLQKWRLTNYYIRKLGKEKDVITKGNFLDTTFVFTPADFSFTQISKEQMTTPELKKHIAYMYASGQPDIEYYEVEMHRRTSSAFSIYVLTLIGVSVASRKMRGGLGWHLVLGIGLSALYEVVMKFSITFATNASLSPFIAVWIPNLLFGAGAYYMMKKAPK